MHEPRYDWTIDEVLAVIERPFHDLLADAHGCHVERFRAHEIEVTEGNRPKLPDRVLRHAALERSALGAPIWPAPVPGQPMSARSTYVPPARPLLLYKLALMLADC